MKTCNPISARQWMDEALRRLAAGGNHDVIANEIRIARRMVAGCDRNLLGGTAPRRRRRRRRRR